MITYQTGRFGLGMIFTCTGSVFPRAASVAFFPAFFTLVVRFVFSYLDIQIQEILPLTLYNTFTAVLGFVVVFRTSIAYSRYWEGINSLRTMGAQWYDAAAGVIAFAETSNKGKPETHAFQGGVARMMSLLHCFALQEVSDLEDEDFDIFDLEGLDQELLRTLRKMNNPRCQLEKVFQWLQISILNAINTKVITTPPPVVSRSFAQLNAGMIAFEKMCTIGRVPFPFPYVQMIGSLLMIHSLITPFLLGSRTDTPLAQGIAMCAFAFFQVFALSSLNLTAQEIEQPFGSDPNDLDIREAQESMNESLNTLLDAHTQALMTFTPPAATTEQGYTREPRKTKWTAVMEAMSSDAVSARKLVQEKGGGEREGTSEPQAKQAPIMKRVSLKEMGEPANRAKQARVKRVSIHEMGTLEPEKQTEIASPALKTPTSLEDKSMATAAAAAAAAAGAPEKQSDMPRQALETPSSSGDRPKATQAPVKEGEMASQDLETLTSKRDRSSTRIPNSTEHQVLLLEAAPRPTPEYSRSVVQPTFDDSPFSPQPRSPTQIDTSSSNSHPPADTLLSEDESQEFHRTTLVEHLQRIQEMQSKSLSLHKEMHRAFWSDPYGRTEDADLELSEALQSFRASKGDIQCTTRKPEEYLNMYL